MDLSELLVRLLRHYDLAVIPGFGGFVARYQPAQMHPVEHLLKPPSKSVGFNPSLKESDGMLLNALMQRGLTHAQATERVKQFSSACVQQMHDHRSLSIPKVGRLMVEADGSITFVQESSTNLLRTSFGLKPVQLTPVLRHREPKVRPIVVEATQRKPRRVAAWIAAASVLAVVAVGTSLYFFNDTVHRHVVGVFGDVFNQSREPQSISVHVPVPGSAHLHADWSQVKDALDPLQATTLSAPITTAPTAPTGTDPVRPDLPLGGSDETGYFVIVGAFSSGANAQRQLERVSGSYPNVSLLKVGGLSQVGVFAGHDEVQANLLLVEVRASFEASAWLAKR